MMEIQLWLYGKPSWDMEIEGKNFIEPELLKIHGQALALHLERISSILQKLQENGWKIAETYGAIYSLTLYKKISRIKARNELHQMGIDLEEINIEQTDDY